MSSEEDDDEDYGALIYRESQLRKAEAAAAAAAVVNDAKKKKKDSSVDVSSISTEDDEVARKRATRKKYRYECSADGCTNKAVSGRVCVKHGANCKRCSSDGCSNQAKRGGVDDNNSSSSGSGGDGIDNSLQLNWIAIPEQFEQNCNTLREFLMFRQKFPPNNSDDKKERKLYQFISRQRQLQQQNKLDPAREALLNSINLGILAYHRGFVRNPHEESTAFTSCFGSEFDKTTLSRPNQRTSAASTTPCSIPEEVIVCRVIAVDNYEEV